MKKTLAIIFAVLLAFGLAACGGGDGEDGNSQAASGSDLELVTDGKSEFTIVYPEGAAEAVMDTAFRLRDELAAATGATFKISEDMAIGDGTGKKEILVGLTDRPESTEILSEMSQSGDYIAKAAGEKIVLQAMITPGLGEVVDAFVESIKTNGTTVAADFVINGQSESMVKYLPAFTHGEFEFSYDCGDDAMMLSYQADQTGYDAYLSDLTQAGFTQYSTNKLGDNSFAVYTRESDNVEVHLSLFPVLSVMHITAEPITYLPALQPETVEAKVTPSISMLGLEGYDTSGSPNQIGESFVFQTSAGNFIIYDGGHNNQLPSDNIYNKLVELAPDPENIVIDAWFISHAHADHMGAIKWFTKDHAKDVTLKLLVMNLPSDEAISVASEYVENANHDLRECAAQYEGCQVFKMHMGQVLYLDDAVVTCYGTYEMIAPQSLEYFNNSCMLEYIDLGGQRINMMGDCAPLETAVLTQIYKDQDLKCDIVQICHHGYQGASSDLYKLLAPDYAFWPGGSRSYENYKEESYNVWVLRTVKKLWIAEDKLVTELLPITYEG